MNETQSIAIAPASPGWMMPVLAIEQAVERYQLLVQVTQKLLKEGLDYGTFPGVEKPSLWKPGAEKLATFFGLSVITKRIESTMDWTGKEFGEPFFHFIYQCSVYRDDKLVVQTEAEANSFEPKHRWRWVTEMEIPRGLSAGLLKVKETNIEEFAFAVEKAETGGKYGKPATYWEMWRDAIASGDAERIEKATKSGKMYSAWRLSSCLYRVPNEDAAGLVNTLVKMGQKRAIVGSVLIAVNGSEFFTQDLEDIRDDDGNVIDAEYEVVREPRAQAAPTKPNGNGKQAKKTEQSSPV